MLLVLAEEPGGSTVLVFAERMGLEMAGNNV